MSIWSSFPFLRIIFVLILGILCARNVTESLPNDLFFNYVPLSLFGLLLFGKITRLSFSTTLTGNLLLVAVFFIGFNRYVDFRNEASKCLEKNRLLQCQVYQGTISSYPTIKNKFISYELTAKNGLNDSTNLTLQSKVLLYVRRNETTEANLKYGDLVAIHGTPSRIQQPKNPHEFDFARYMADQNIYYQHFVEPEQLEVIQINTGNPLIGAVFRARSHLEKIITSSIKSPDEQAIVLALLLGIKGQLDQDIKESYAAAGAMHVLAVSGLHVSIIYILISFFLSLIPSHSIKKYLTVTLGIAALWTYALLTGFSPSILRAVTMLSIIILGQSMNRRANTYNSLALAAFILLLFNPIQLFSVGFQLSFLAVTGIVYIHPLIYKLWETKSILTEKAWTLTCVSIAAQIATFPLSVYYFHQFPTYFLLSNIIVIAGAFLIMCLGIFMLLLKSVFNMDWMGSIVEFITYWMNMFVAFIHHLEWSVLDWIYISASQSLMLYLMIFLSFVLLYYRKKRYAIAICILVIAFNLEKTIQVIHQSTRQNLTFYSVRNSSLMDEVNGLKTQLHSLDTIRYLSRIERNISPNRLFNSLPPIITPSLIKANSAKLTSFAYLQVHQGKKILYLTQPFEITEIQYLIKTDLIIISNNAVHSLSKLSEVIQYDKVLLDSSNDNYYCNKIIKEGLLLNQEIIDAKSQAVILSSREQKFLDMFF